MVKNIDDLEVGKIKQRFALADMPNGTSSMPGPKQGGWGVYQFRNGEAVHFKTL